MKANSIEIVLMDGSKRELVCVSKPRKNEYKWLRHVEID